MMLTRVDSALILKKEKFFLSLLAQTEELPLFPNSAACCHLKLIVKASLITFDLKLRYRIMMISYACPSLKVKKITVIQNNALWPSIKAAS